jgi:uncharacterized repeat protein (TIGR03803 family)
MALKFPSRKVQSILPFCALALPFMTANASATPTLTTLKSFCNTGTPCSGFSAFPQPMIEDGSGNFFGATAFGGSHGGGNVFEIKKVGSSYTYTDLYDFCPSASCSDGQAPVDRLVIDTSGNLYGETQYGGTSPYCNGGCGTIFELSPNGAGSIYALTTLYDFCVNSSCTDGEYPKGGLTYVGAPGSSYNGSSALYGTAIHGGSANAGVDFALTNVSSTPAYSVIYNMCSATNCADGAVPTGLIPDGSGNLYGVTAEGGAYPIGAGIVYELSPAGGGTFTQTVLWTFCATNSSCPDGQFPDGPLVMSSSGKLFGTTHYGGSNGEGTVFRVTPAGTSSTETVRYSFCSLSSCTDGSIPVNGGLALDGSGNVYGTTSQGGAYNQGSIYKLTSTTLTTLYSFCPTPGCTDGADPEGGVALDASGNVFGQTNYSGAYNGGSMFKLTP